MVGLGLIDTRKFVVAKIGQQWVLRTPIEDGGDPWMRWQILVPSFDDAIARMNKWARGRRLGIDQEELFRRIAL